MNAPGSNDYFQFARSLDLGQLVAVGIHLMDGFIQRAYPPEELNGTFCAFDLIEAGLKGNAPYLYNKSTGQFIFIGGKGAEALYNILNVEYARRRPAIERIAPWMTFLITRSASQKG